MKCCVRTRHVRFLAAFAAVTCTVPAFANGLPAIKTSATNRVPECATPGRLMSFLESRNEKFSPNFRTIAADYMRMGQQLNIRWDMAFFQMVLETGSLHYTGDVSSKQNNFAGLGATGGGVPGESFPDVKTGVRAHLEHLLLYAGEHVNQPVAERTKKVQEWDVLSKWHSRFNRPITYSDIGQKWAPGSKYAYYINSIADAFYTGVCRQPDPNPEMMALVDPSYKADKQQEVASDDSNMSGAELAQRAVREAYQSGSFVRSSLGGSSLIAEKKKTNVAENEPAPKVQILNQKTDPPDIKKKIKTAGVGTNSLAASQVAPKPKTKADPATCHVWRASYGGERAVMIKAVKDGATNFTVLDVNESSSDRETAAYIAAYAKGGNKIANFSSPDMALKKAFELCPDKQQATASR